MSETLSKQEHNEVGTLERTHEGATFSPRVDIWESNEELRLYADLPGVSPENLDIQFENRELRIHGRVGTRHADRHFLGGEYGIGDFYRTFAIGESINAQAISAELQNGVLVLHLPKTEAVKPRKIEVKSL
jgi:HSP20 family protein